MTKAARFQQLGTIMWLQLNTTRLGPQHISQLAARHESCEMVSWALTVRQEIPMLYDLECAAQFGRLDCLQMLSLHNASTHIIKNIKADVAARNGHLPAVKWLHSMSAHFSATTMDVAAEFGHLDVVRWLNRYRTEGCTTAAINSAARNGHLEVIQWLKRRRGESCSSAAMLFAVLSRRMDVVQWIHDNFNTPWVGRLVDIAAKSGNLQMVQWLLARYPATCTSAAMDNAARGGHTECFLFLHSLGKSCTSRAMDNFATRGDIAKLNWLSEHRKVARMLLSIRPRQMAVCMC